MLKYCFSRYTWLQAHPSEDILSKGISFEFIDKETTKELYKLLGNPLNNYVESMGNKYDLDKFNYFPPNLLKMSIGVKMELSEEFEVIAKMFEEEHSQNFIDFYEEEKSKLKPS